MSMTRRQVLRSMSLGAGGVAMAPLLRRIEAHAAGNAAAMPKRFVFVVKSSGIGPQSVRPVGVDIGDGSKLVDLPLRDLAMADTLASLEPFKDQVMILDGLSGAHLIANHSSYYGALSCHHAPDKPVAATVDCLLGGRYPAPFPIYGFAPNGHAIGSASGPIVQNGAVFPKISAFGQNKPMAYQASAEKAYRQLFGSALNLSTGGQREFGLQTNLLDFLAEDAARLSQAVSGDEREKIDQYLGAFESVRARNRMLEELRPTIAKNAPELTTQYASTDFCDRIKTFFELTGASLIAGLTNVVSIRIDWLSVKYAALGFKSTSVHDIGHGKTTDNGMKSAEATDAIRRFHVEQIAGLAARLRAVPEGDGTMLDNTMIIYVSDTGEAHHARGQEWPFVIVGGNGHGLRTAGRYLRYPTYGRNGHKTIGNWYNTLLHSSGMPIEPHFGQVDPNLRDLDLAGPLSELLA